MRPLFRRYDRPHPGPLHVERVNVRRFPALFRSQVQSGRGSALFRFNLRAWFASQPLRDKPQTLES